MTNIATLLTGSAAAHADRIAVRHEATALTYAQLDDLTARTAALLQDRGVRPGDRVAVIAPNVPHFPIAYYSVLRAGAVVVPMNPLLKAREIAFILRDAGARMVLTSPMSAAETAEAAAATETDCLVLEPDGFDALLRRIEPVAAVLDALLEGYGLSETSPVAAFNMPDRPRKPGSVGLPVRGVELRLVNEDGTTTGPGEVGEIAIRGENVMAGYHRRPRATKEAIRGGWFHTGDLARVDEDGCYFIVDRAKDMIIRGGYNVYPREVEEVLYKHPAVAEAAVVGIPDPRLGEEIAAMGESEFAGGLGQDGHDVGGLAVPGTGGLRVRGPVAPSRDRWPRLGTGGEDRAADLDPFDGAGCAAAHEQTGDGREAGETSGDLFALGPQRVRPGRLRGRTGNSRAGRPGCIDRGTGTMGGGHGGDKVVRPTRTRAQDRGTPAAHIGPRHIFCRRTVS
ncbi:AMP-binding protein [Streptomyces sp. NPDC058049]|uniref:AMP-binding protein n=1 Tax=Streptomyces sp. NPDC058049 TaxID=3346314 RepID=UPI0036EA622F